MSTQGLLYKNKIDVNQRISIAIPYLGEVIDNEDEYYGLVTLLTAMPIDLMLLLDSVGIDFTTINDYELFLRLFPEIQETPKEISRLVFGDLDLTKFKLDINPKNGMIILNNPEDGIIIDRAIHGKIAATLRFLHNFEKDRRTPGNESAKRYLLERAKVKSERNKKKKKESQLESLIISMVNTEQFKYDFDTVRNLTIYQFNKSVKQIMHKIDYEHRMHGVYAGTIDSKKLSQDDLSWLSN